MITGNHISGSFKIEEGQITLPSGYKFLKERYDNFDTSPQDGNPEILFFDEVLAPLGFQITEQTEEPEEIY